jgi:MinD superfamily P-loop ATPase
VVITEPTLSGIHDLKRVLLLTAHFGVRTAVVVNKFDLNGEVFLQMEEFLKSANIPLLGRIHFDTTVNLAIAEGRTVIEYSAGRAAREMTLAAEETIALANHRLDVGASMEFRGN